VRNAIRAFTDRGTAALTPGASRPHTVHAAFDAVGAERLTALLHRSPRDFGHPTSLWTLELAAGTAHAAGLTPTRVSGETVRATLARRDIHWKRPSAGSPAPTRRTTEKSARDRLIRLAATHPDWALGFADEVWWSRIAQPPVRAGTATGQPLRLVEQTVAEHQPKAVACYGLLVRWWAVARGDDPTEALWLRFVDGRPISGVTIPFLAWCTAKLAAAGKTALLLVWDNASWRISRAVKAWIVAHNRQIKTGAAAVRIVVCSLPIKSPWLNPIEPKWVHGKQCIVEPARLLPLEELETRVYAALGVDHADHLTMPEKVA
jgi:hypothetical protein